VAVQRFNFAWADASETTFGVEHQVEQEDVFSFNVEHAEGDFPAATIVIKNPRIGLLNATRKQWAWLSREDTPLFFGRLIGIPNDINQETVTLEFIGRPADYGEQKAELAETLRTLPYYDPVFIQPDAQMDDDTVLEARPEAWHIDRTTLEVTTSHILVGEDGVEEFMESEVPYDSVQINIGQVPIRNLQVTADVSWTQAHSGSVNIGTYNFLTYTGKSLIDDWPDPGANLGGGWTATLAYALDNWNIDATETVSNSVTWNNPAQKHAGGDTLSTSISSTLATLQGDSVKITLTSGGASGEEGASSSSTWMRVPLWSVKAALTAQYDASRNRKESIAFTLSANFQALLTLPGDEEVAQLQVGGGDVGVPLLDASIPIGDVKNRSYFSTDRGLRSLEYLILRARSQIMMSSRAVAITFSCLFDRAIALSCRMDGLLHDHRIPGAQAVGKITKYGFSCDGESGLLIGSVTIECSIGYAEAIEEVEGEPTISSTSVRPLCSTLETSGTRRRLTRRTMMAWCSRSTKHRRCSSMKRTAAWQRRLQRSTRSHHRMRCRTCQASAGRRKRLMPSSIARR
jgi:hypothetical protein